MNPTAHTTPSDRDLALADLLEEINEKLQAGEPVDPEAYAAMHPGMAARLRELLPTLEVLFDLSSGRAGADPSDSGPQGGAKGAGAHVAGTGTLGDFRILREIGRGGMGVVYEAEQISLGRRVALKVLPFAAVMDPRQLQRFQNEARAAASLKHPHIVSVFSVGCERGVHYYAMEYVEGKTLAQVTEELRDTAQPSDRLTDLLSRKTPTDESATSGSDDPTVDLDSKTPAKAETRRESRTGVSTKPTTRTAEFFQTAARLGIQAAEALEHAHQMGIIHRDIKPSNVLVDACGHLWITDFGLAIVTTPSPLAGEGWGEGAAGTALTMTGDILGTLRYMSPEQAAGRSRVTDHHTDIYSLGVTLYELLTLRPPFVGDDRQLVLRQITDDDPPPPRQLNRSIPKDLETILLKAMAKEPTARYATAQALADDLRRFLSDEPIRARRAGPVVRVKKWTKRHKAFTAVVAASLVAVAVFATVTTVRAYQRDVRLTAIATEGLADVRLAIAQKEFAEAQRRATKIQVELAEAPKLQAQFGPALEDLMHEAEAKLRLQRFEKLSEEARFTANRLTVQWEWGVREHAEARRRCREALAVFHVLDDDRWLEHLGTLPLDRAEVTQIKESLTELLSLLAKIEGLAGGHSGARRAIELLNQVETFASNHRAMFEHRGRYWTVLGEDDAARGDFQRAETMQSSTWLDHYFRAVDLKGNKPRDALHEIEAALTVRVDDYWSWYLWSEIQSDLGEPDRARWGLSVCIRLRPQESMAWILRGRQQQPGADKLADYTKAAELSMAPALRAEAYRCLAIERYWLGQTDAALADSESAIRLAPDNPWCYWTRAMCYQSLGRTERARADARRVLDLTPKPKWFFDYTVRSHALEMLGQTQQVVDEWVAMLQAEANQERVLSWERGKDRLRNPRHAFALAMTRWKLGQKEEAWRWYDKAVQWIDKTKPEDESLRRFHEEAAAMLGIPVTPPAAKEKTEKAK